MGSRSRSRTSWILQAQNSAISARFGASLLLYSSSSSSVSLVRKSALLVESSGFSGSGAGGGMAPPPPPPDLDNSQPPPARAAIKVPPSAICSARLNLRHFSASVSAPRGPRGPVIARKTPGPISFCALLAFWGDTTRKKIEWRLTRRSGGAKEERDDERSSSEYTLFREGTGSSL